MTDNIIFLACGFVAGVAFTFILIWILMPRLMLNVKKSKLNLEDTVAAIQERALKNKWLVPKVYDLQSTLQKTGYNKMTPLKIISQCQPHYAYEILKDDGNKKVTAIMPCRVGVFEDKNGVTYVSRMNISLLSRMFGGTIAEVMAGVAKEEEEMLGDLLL